MDINESYKDLDECCDHPLHDVSGDVIIRDRLTVCGNLRAHKVDPAERGLFLTEESLRESCTVCRKGDWALVGEKSPFKVYRWDNGWYDTEATHEVNIPLNEYLTKEEALQTYVSDAELQAEADTRKQADDSLAQDIADLNNKDVLIAQDIATLKERNNAEIPAYTGIVENATIKDKESVMQYSGVYFIKSEGRFAAKKGSEYFGNWLAYGGYQAQQVYHQDNKAVPNRLYNLIALSGGGLHYFDGTSFKVVNDNADIQTAVTTNAEAITSLQGRAVNHEGTLTTHGKQITALQTKVQEVMYTNTEQQTAINSQGTRLTEVEHRADEHDTKIGIINTSITTLQERATAHDDILTTHMNQIAGLQKNVENAIFVNIKQNNDITLQGNRITETENSINEHNRQLEFLYSDFVLMLKNITDLTTRIEALEKGGSSSADVEDGTLSAIASVVNGVMSVQGSVEDGILKL